MFERKILSKLMAWKSRSHKPMVLKGQRQIGKTTIAEYFGRTEYEDYVILDMFKDPVAKAIMEEGIAVDSIIDSISVVQEHRIGTKYLFDNNRRDPRVHQSEIQTKTLLRGWTF